MSDFYIAFIQAWDLISHLDSAFLEIVLLSLKVSGASVFIATLIGLPVGAALALFRFRGRSFFLVLVNTLMGFPPVVVGLLLYLVLSRSGPLGVLGLLFTPTAMIIAQVILVTPIIAALSQQIIQDSWSRYQEQLLSLGSSRGQAIPTLILDARSALITAVLAGFGRASGEVGAVMIVGGNIDHVTRVMTTAITLEVSKGDLSLALGLGMVLIFIALLINFLSYMVQNRSVQRFSVQHNRIR
ncbi:MAG: tungstate transport system permease protein [Saprospiraceae bacterium]|jgi:tungstate transport system permease protein